MLQLFREVCSSEPLLSALIHLFLYFSRHPTSSSSCADILSVLFFRQMKYKPSEPRDPAADRFVMSKVFCIFLNLPYLELSGVFVEDK